MSGEYDQCSEHTTDCRCNMEVIKIWAQMFFDDGSLTQGVRIPAQWLDEEYTWQIEGTAKMLLDSVNRQEGWLLIWGAGNMVFKHYPSAFSSSELSESDSSA